MKSCLFILFSVILSPCFGQNHDRAEYFMNDPLINKKAAISIPSSLLKTYTFEQGLAEVILKDTLGGIEKRRIGFVNPKGKFEIAPIYLKSEKFSHGILALLNEKLNWEFYTKESGFIKTSGSFEDYRIISPKYILVAEKNKWGLLLIGEKENKLIQPSYKNIEYVSDNKFIFYHFDSWQLINKDKLVLQNYLYDSLSFINGGYLKYQLKKSVGIIDFQGQEVNNFQSKEKADSVQMLNLYQKEKISQPFKRVVENNKYGVLGTAGNIIIPLKFDSIAGPYDHIFVVYAAGKLGIIDDKGIVLTEPEKKYEKVFPFVEGRAMFVKNAQYGFIDQRGNVRVAPQYLTIRNYKEGLAALVLNGKWGFIDKDENIVIQPLYEEVLDVRNGMARVKLKGKWHLVNKQDKIVMNAYDAIEEGENNKWLLIKDEKLGLADKTGMELLAPRYKYLKDLKNGLVIVQKGEKWGVLDYNENFIFPIEYDFVIYDASKELFLVMKKGIREEAEVKF